MSEPFIAEVKPFAYNFAPRGWAICEGQILSIAQNQALFALLGTTYGGNGQTTFALPDLRGRVPVHWANSNISQGEQGGSETTTLSIQNLPSHSHGLMASTDEATSRTPEGNYLAAQPAQPIYQAASPNTSLDNSIVRPTGQTLPFSRMQPYLAINFCIALVGVFPSRD